MFTIRMKTASSPYFDLTLRFRPLTRHPNSASLLILKLNLVDYIYIYIFVFIKVRSPNLRTSSLGALQLVDLRSHRLAHAFVAHSAAVTEIACKGDLVVTAGMMHRMGHTHPDAVRHVTYAFCCLIRKYGLFA